MKRIRARFAGLLLAFLSCACSGVFAAEAETRHAELQAAAGKDAERFAAILTEHPEDEAAIVGRIRALLSLDRWTEARDESARFAAALPRSAEVLGVHGEALLRAGALEDAASLLQRVAGFETPPPRALAALGRIRIAEGRGEAGAALIGLALEAAPEDPEVVYWAADLAAERSRSIELLERYLAGSAGRDPDRVASARGALEFTRQLGDRKVWVPLERPERMEVPLTTVLTEGNRVLGWAVQVELGPRGKKARVLIDSGTGGLYLVHRVARKNGFEPLAEQTRLGEGGDRRHETERGVIPALRLGELRFADALASTTRTEFDPQGGFHGLLGLSRFHGYRVTLDLRKRRLRLEPGSVEFDGEPYWMLSGQMLVRAEIPGAESGLFLFDTGAGTTVLAASLVERLEQARLGEPIRLRGFGGEVEGARAVGGVEVRFAAGGTGETPLGVIDLSERSRVGGVELSGFLGRDLMDGSTLVIDTVARRIRVERTR